MLRENEKIIIVSCFIVFAVILIGGWSWWFFKMGISSPAMPSVHPSPFTTGVNSRPLVFDVQKDQFLFLITGVNPQQQTMQLQFLFPKEFQNKIIHSQIMCTLEDSRVTYTFGPASTNQTASATKALYLYPIKLNATVFRGRCGGPECNVITSDCELIIQK